jgi:putative glutamine amidotransferase
MTVRPIIGITCYVERAAWTVWDAPAALLPLAYLRAVEAAGGRPLILPPSDDGGPETLDAVDALVLAGGADIDPSLYGAARGPETTDVRPDRDRFESALLEGALRRDMPVLGVCRGMQMMNVVAGGDLVQELRGRGHREAPGVFARHEITIDPGSRLCSILGDRSVVASHHHQAPGRLGRGLTRAAWADDGVVEAIEHPSRSFAIGILWHPEETEDRAIFEALVDAGAKRRGPERKEGSG